MLRRLAVKVAIAQICGKEVAEKIEIKKTEDGCVRHCTDVPRLACKVSLRMAAEECLLQ